MGDLNLPFMRERLGEFALSIDTGLRPGPVTESERLRLCLFNALATAEHLTHLLEAVQLVSSPAAQLHTIGYMQAARRDAMGGQ